MSSVLELSVSAVKVLIWKFGILPEVFVVLSQDEMCHYICLLVPSLSPPKQFCDQELGCIANVKIYENSLPHGKYHSIVTYL